MSVRDGCGWADVALFAADVGVTAAVPGAVVLIPTARVTAHGDGGRLVLVAQPGARVVQVPERWQWTQRPYLRHIRNYKSLYRLNNGRRSQIRREIP